MPPVEHHLGPLPRVESVERSPVTAQTKRGRPRDVKHAAASVVAQAKPAVRMADPDDRAVLKARPDALHRMKLADSVSGRIHRLGWRRRRRRLQLADAGTRVRIGTATCLCESPRCTGKHHCRNKDRARDQPSHAHPPIPIQMHCTPILRPAETPERRRGEVLLG